MSDESIRAGLRHLKNLSVEERMRFVIEHDPQFPIAALEKLVNSMTWALGNLEVQMTFIGQTGTLRFKDARVYIVNHPGGGYRFFHWPGDGGPIRVEPHRDRPSTLPPEDRWGEG